jgi:hypothetical protein
VKEFARGLLLGPTDGNPGSDFDPDVNTKQKLAKAVYRRRVLGEAPPSEITGDTTRFRRYKHFLTVWDDYENIYGTNTPMKRCETQLVQWDYNFDGLAHYGMMPDFFQDLTNVGLNATDMSPMFRSAEDFARMWTRSLEAAYDMTHPFLAVDLDLGLGGTDWRLRWKGQDGDTVEETDNLSDPRSWRPFHGQIERQGTSHSIMIRTGGRLHQPLLPSATTLILIRARGGVPPSRLRGFARGHHGVEGASREAARARGDGDTPRQRSRRAIKPGTATNPERTCRVLGRPPGTDRPPNANGVASFSPGWVEAREPTLGSRPATHPTATRLWPGNNLSFSFASSRLRANSSPT